jgi:hypothetical protein
MQFFCLHALDPQAHFPMWVAFVVTLVLAGSIGWAAWSIYKLGKW